MPSLSNGATTMATNTSNKSSAINAMLMRAWRERWNDAQWGTHIKTVLPRDITGDSFDLAGHIIQQAFVGSDANKLVLSYLRHSLSSRQVSHAAVLKRISKFDGFNRPYCLIALLDFLDATISGTTCRTVKEQKSLPDALLSLLFWLTQVLASVLDVQIANEFISPQYQQVLNISLKVFEKILASAFVMSNIYIAKLEDPELLTKLQDKLVSVKNSLSNKKVTSLANAKEIDALIRKVISIQLDGEILERNKALIDKSVESITFCLQPYVTVSVLLNPNSSTQTIASHLQMIRQLKNYSMSRVYVELIRGALISLHNVATENDISRESMWFAFTFIKVPHIIKHMNLKNAESQPAERDHCPDVISALEMVIDDPTLDLLDTTCACNTIEYLLNELTKHYLITAQHAQQFASQRDPVMVSLSKMDLNHQPSSIIKHLKKAESPLSGILKALDNDYNKMQEMLGMLCELLSGNNFELILSVATMEGKLKTFVSRLIRWNENSKQVSPEMDKSAMNRSSLFDVTFLMLTFIVQTFGAKIVLDENGDTFFEKWVREFMIEKHKNKSAMNMVTQCEQSKVDDFLASINASDSSPSKATTVKWHDVCAILPGVLYQLLVAWENDTISAADVKVHLDNIKGRLSSYSVCAAAWLCSYMQIVRDDELLKPMNMVQQFITSNLSEEFKATNNLKERLNLTSQIIRKMQTDAQLNQKVRSPMLNIVSNQPLEEQFHDVWRSVSNRGWLSVKATQVLDNLLQSCGPYWLVSKLVNEVIYCKFSKDISKSMDIVFAIMHLDIQKCTVVLLSELLPMILLNKTQKFELIEPQLSILARLCVYSIISSLEKTNNKAKRSFAGKDANEHRPAKIRKVDESLLDILSDGPEKMESTSNGDCNGSTSTAIKLPEPLKGCLQHLFQTLFRLTFSSDLTPKVIFVQQFLIFLHRCGGECILPILNVIPNGLMKNLLKISMVDGTTFNYDFILRMYDLSRESGRQSALADLSLLQILQQQIQSKSM